MTRLRTNLDALITEIARDRFSPNSRLAFAKMKSLTKYHSFQKRDGAIVN
jgi:hypothetical protein